MVLPVEIVERLGLATPYERTVELVTGESAVADPINRKLDHAPHVLLMSA